MFDDLNVPTVSVVENMVNFIILIINYSIILLKIKRRTLNVKIVVMTIFLSVMGI